MLLNKPYSLISLVLTISSFANGVLQPTEVNQTISEAPLGRTKFVLGGICVKALELDLNLTTCMRKLRGLEYQKLEEELKKAQAAFESASLSFQTGWKKLGRDCRLDHEISQLTGIQSTTQSTSSRLSTTQSTTMRSPERNSTANPPALKYVPTFMQSFKQSFNKRIGTTKTFWMKTKSCSDTADCPTGSSCVLDETCFGEINICPSKGLCLPQNIINAVINGANRLSSV